MIYTVTMVKLSGFKQFVEDEIRSLKGKNDKENYIDGMHRELGINPNDIPKFIECPVHIKDEGLWYNLAVWEVIKPIEPEDHFVRIKFHKSISPNLNQQCYRRGEDGKMMPYPGDPSGRIHLIPMDQFANEMLGKAWQSAVQQPPMGM